MPPVSRGKETGSMCVRNAFFLWEPVKGCSGSTKQGFELEHPTTGVNRTICLFVAGEQGGMGTKGNVNALNALRRTCYWRRTSYSLKVLRAAQRCVIVSR